MADFIGPAVCEEREEGREKEENEERHEQEQVGMGLLLHRTIDM